MDWSKPTTQLLGRFQPWHKGHTELFKRALAKTGQVVILLREQDGTEKNPFDYAKREDMLVESLREEGFDRGIHFDVVRMPNITHITYGRDVGYKIEQEFLGEEIESISATDIRRKLQEES